MLNFFSGEFFQFLDPSIIIIIIFELLYYQSFIKKLYARLNIVTRNGKTFPFLDYDLTKGQTTGKEWVRFRNKERETHVGFIAEIQ